MLYTQEENLNNGEHDLFSYIFFYSQGGGGNVPDFRALLVQFSASEIYLHVYGFRKC